MPKPRPPYLQKETARGKIFWYVRVRPRPRVRIRGEYGSPEFMAAYQAAVNGDVMLDPVAKTASANSLAWLIGQYRNSAEWHDYRQATRRQRDNIFNGVISKVGHVPYAIISRKDMIASRDARMEHPAAAANFLKAMSALFKWAAESEYISDNPALGVKPPKKRGNEGFKPWTEEDIDKYCACWPIGTKERVWLDVLLYTGLRRGDAVRIGRQHVKDGIAVLRTEKSGFKTEVNLPILPVLQATLDAGPTGDLAFICGAGGQPMAKESFGNAFRAACNKAGIAKSAHGIRKMSATRAANAGATVAQLKAIFGWTSDSMPSLYTKTADRRKLSLDAIAKLTKAG